MNSSVGQASMGLNYIGGAVAPTTPPADTSVSGEINSLKEAICQLDDTIAGLIRLLQPVCLEALPEKHVGAVPEPDRCGLAVNIYSIRQQVDSMTDALRRMRLQVS